MCGWKDGRGGKDRRVERGGRVEEGGKDGRVERGGRVKKV
jgi:hypothetical protein